MKVRFISKGRYPDSPEIKGESSVQTNCEGSTVTFLVKTDSRNIGDANLNLHMRLRLENMNSSINKQKNSIKVKTKKISNIYELEKTFASFNFEEMKSDV